jgi:hypothetical protein
MPANTTFGLLLTAPAALSPDRNFDKLFDGDGQMPIDKDAVPSSLVMGSSMTNPLFNWRLYDSAPAVIPRRFNPSFLFSETLGRRSCRIERAAVRLNGD